jgi:phosphatidylglycerophosphatase C
MFDYPDDTVAVFDLDGTLTHRDSYLGILLHSLRLNPSSIPRLGLLVSPVLRFKLGLIDNTRLKTDFLRVLMAPLDKGRLDRVAGTFIERLFNGGFRKEALAMLQRHRAAGHETVLLSASPDFYVEDIARRLAFDHCLCTGTVRRRDDTLSGELRTRNCQGGEKLARLKSHFGDAFRRRYFVGYGDHATDILLLEQLDTGIMVNPRPSVRDAARRAGLQVVDWK